MKFSINSTKIIHIANLKNNLQALDNDSEHDLQDNSYSESMRPPMVQEFEFLSGTPVNEPIPEALTSEMEQSDPNDQKNGFREIAVQTVYMNSESNYEPKCIYYR